MKVKELFGDNDVLKRNTADVMLTEVDGETVIMNTNTGKYLGLNEVGTEIWKILEKDNSLNKIVQVLLKEYEVKAEICKKETKQFLNNLFRLNLLVKT